MNDPRAHHLPDGYDAADLEADGVRAGDMLELRSTLVASDEQPPEPPQLPRRDKDFHARLIAEIEGFVDRQGLVPDAVGGWIDARTGAPTGCDTGELVLDFLLKQRHVWTQLTRGYVEETLTALVRGRRVQRRAELIAGFTGKPASVKGREALMQWVGAVTGLDASDPRFTESYAVMLHWMWLIKRMALGLRTEHDLMPIIYGPQGSGKSTATERLCEPLHELAMPMNASNLTDERKFRQLGRCLVGRWEEMQGAQKGDIEALKNTITARSVAYRRLNTHDNDVLLRSCGFIGTSNHPVDVMIADTTGARRFYQLTTPAVIDRKAINQLDATDLWLAISETDPAPLLPLVDQVRTSQAELVQRDAASLWLEAESWGPLNLISPDEHQNIVIQPYDERRGEPFESIAIRFRHWCQRVGQVANNVRTFAQRLQQEGFTVTRPHATKGVPRVRMYHRPASPASSQTPAPPPVADTSTRTDADELTERGRKLRSDPSSSEDRFSPEAGADGAMPFEPPF